MKKNHLIYLLLSVFLLISVTGSSGFITAYDDIRLDWNKINPEGRIIFFAGSAGSCGVAWGYGPGSNESNSSHTPDAYIEPGKGFMFTFGTMLYHELDGILVNYLIEDNESKVLWPLRERTGVSIRWQHETVKHSLNVMLKPQAETVGGFIDPKFYVIPPPTNETQPSEFCSMEFSGIHRNGSKIESVSGFAGLFAIGVNNPWPTFPEPTIVIYLIQKRDGGEFDPLLVVLWSKDGGDLLGTTIERAKVFYVNFWALKRD
ncbi:MAG: hypothetical protein KAJ44_06920 [Thermoplasmatales archaeon]|nr:hypothetical protein [Thermoplasmatales archaeon]